MTDAWTLVQRVQEGDKEAFGEIYERYHSMMAGWIYKRVGHRQLAEDLTADTFLRALKRIDAVSWQGKDLGAWLTTIARNLIADHFKSARCRLDVTIGDLFDIDRADDDRYCLPEWAALASLTNADLAEAMKQLNPEQRQVVSLRYLEQMSTDETALAMGKTTGAISGMLYRALLALRLIMAGGESRVVSANG